MRFADLKIKIRSLIWAAGEAENLVVAHDNMFQEAMGFLQSNCPEEKDFNTNVSEFIATYFKCGLTVVPAPKGDIIRVFTIANGNYCDPVYFDQVGIYEPERWSRNLLNYVKTSNDPLPDLPIGFQAADQSTDLITTLSIFSLVPIPGRARRGIWTIRDRYIEMAPWIQSNESVVVVWRGTKKVWGDDDIVSDEIDVQKYVKLYVAYAHERDFGTDRATKNDAQQEMAIALGDVMIEWKQNMKQRHHKSMEWRNRTPAELQQSGTDPLLDEDGQPILDENENPITTP